MSEMFTKCNGFIVSGDPLVYADSATMTGQGTVSEPFGVKSTDLFVQEPLYTGTSGNSAYIGWNNETVLWENTNKTPTRNVTWPQQLSESIANFDYVDVYYNGDGTSEFAPRIHNFSTSGNGYYNLFDMYNPPNTNNIFYRLCKLYLSGTVMNVVDNFTYNFPAGDNNHTGYNTIYKVVGINRKV